jgi:hypothetical protein
VFINSRDILVVLLPFYFILFFIFNNLYINTCVTWCGHLVITNFNFNLTFLFLFLFFFVNLIILNSIYFSSREVYDFMLVIFNFLVWVLLLFYSNTLFCIIFFFEILATLLFLLLVTSSFSTIFSYRKLNHSWLNYFKLNFSIFLINSFLYFFWVSLLASVLIFFFLLLFIHKFNTFDWYLLEYLYYYILFNISIFESINIFIIWFGLLSAFFIKTGLVPFFFWKPIFFKGVPFYFIFFYTLFYYTAILIFFIIFIIFYFLDLFLNYIYVYLFFLLFGFFMFIFVLGEGTYIKTFFAFSSILNTLLLLFFLISNNIIDIFFFF